MPRSGARIACWPDFILPVQVRFDYAASLSLSKRSILANHAKIRLQSQRRAKCKEVLPQCEGRREGNTHSSNWGSKDDPLSSAKQLYFTKGARFPISTLHERVGRVERNSCQLVVAMRAERQVVALLPELLQGRPFPRPSHHILETELYYFISGTRLQRLLFFTAGVSRLLQFTPVPATWSWAACGWQCGRC